MKDVTGPAGHDDEFGRSSSDQGGGGLHSTAGEGSTGEELSVSVSDR